MRLTGWISLALVCLSVEGARATPSTTYWTPGTMDIQAPGVWHLTLDNYFTVGRGALGNGGESFPTDFGLTYGFKLSHKLQGEVGFDLLEPSDDPVFFNGKIGFAEGALGKGAPGVQVGVFNAGTRRGTTNQNVLDLIVGKTLPHGMGRLHAAVYYGNPGVLRSSKGERENTGFMVAYDRYLDSKHKWMLAGDYASGKNAIGGGGVGIYHFFTPNIDLLVGPVWFNDRGINGNMKWTTQLDVNF